MPPQDCMLGLHSPTPGTQGPDGLTPPEDEPTELQGSHAWSPKDPLPAKVSSPG